MGERWFKCPRCGRWGPWTDGTMRAVGDERDEYWCQVCGAETPMPEARLWIVEDGFLRYLLDRAAFGEVPGLLLAELYANSESETVPPAEPEGGPTDG